MVVRDLAYHLISLNAFCLWVIPSAIPSLHSDQIILLKYLTSEEQMAQLNQELEENQPKAPVPQKFLDIRDQRLRDSEDRQLHET